MHSTLKAELRWILQCVAVTLKFGIDMKFISISLNSY